MVQKLVLDKSRDCGIIISPTNIYPVGEAIYIISSWLLKVNMDELIKLIDAGQQLCNALDEEHRSVNYKEYVDRWKESFDIFMKKYPDGFFISQVIPHDIYISLEQGE